jgi:hypothetical protein
VKNVATATFFTFSCKAGRNPGLVEDGNLGAHNPEFTVEVLEASIGALR